MQEDQNGFLTFLTRLIILHVGFLIVKLDLEYMQGFWCFILFLFQFHVPKVIEREVFLKLLKKVEENGGLIQKR